MGHLDLLKWARASECPWDEETCKSACKNGHLDVFVWSRENECPFDLSSCISNAQDNGHWDILQWIQEHDEPLAPRETAPLVSDAPFNLSLFLEDEYDGESGMF